ncbi:MAG: FG-GAP repeat protein, partial [bacterium]
MGAGQIQRRAPGPLRGRAGAALAALLGLAWTLGLPLPPVGLLGPLGRVPAAHASHPTFAVLTTAGRGGSTELRAFARDGGLIGGLSPYGSFSGGSYVASADVSGDGHADIITGAGAGGGPHVIIFDGVTGSPIRSFFAYPTNFTGGAFVAAGDVDGDGKADIITGAGAGGTPHVKVFDVSGQNIKEIRSFQAYGQGFTGGVRVAAGFVTPDNRADIITGAGPGGGPHVKVFDGNTGGELGGLLAYGGFTGGVYVASGDLNGDRLADIITGPGPGGGPHVKAFSGLNGAEMRNFFAYDAGFTGGVFVGGG